MLEPRLFIVSHATYAVGDVDGFFVETAGYTPPSSTVPSHQARDEPSQSPFDALAWKDTHERQGGVVDEDIAYVQVGR